MPGAGVEVRGAQGGGGRGQGCLGRVEAVKGCPGQGWRLSGCVPTEIPERPYLSLTSLRAAMPGLGPPLDGLSLVGGRTQPVHPHHYGAWEWAVAAGEAPPEKGGAGAAGGAGVETRRGV